MRLHALIESKRGEIIDAWLAFARTCLPASQTMDTAALRDHASEMLDAIVVDLQNAQTTSQRNCRWLGQDDAPRTLHEDGSDGTAAQSHGAGRARTGFSIEQLVAEHRALRASVLRVWLSESNAWDSGQFEELMRFDEAVDQALAESVASYARVVETVLQKARFAQEERVELGTQELARLHAVLLAETRERRRAEDARARLMRQLLKAQEDEQARIARELHDQFGQQLTALSLRVTSLGELETFDEEGRRIVAEIRNIVGQLDDEVDFLVWRLGPAVLDELGLGEAIIDHVQNWSTLTGVAAHTDLYGIEAERLSEEVETVLFRVAQEALNNVAKHARARNVDVLVKRTGGQVLLQIADDGVGLDLQHQPSERDKHFGLAGMTERVELVGGTVAVEGRPGKGTTVLVRIPIGREESAAQDHEDSS